MKKSYYCNRLENEINFDCLNVSFCCATRTGPLISADNVKNLKKIFGFRKKLIKDMQKGIVPKECDGCFDLKEKKTEKFSFKNLFKKEKNQVSNFIIKHFKQCDCRCIYCSEKYISPYKNIVTTPKKSDYYDLLPVVKEMYEKNFINLDNTRVDFQGGNISVLEEFEDLMDIFIKNNAKFFQIFTNGIEYMPSIAQASEQIDILMNISLDSGCRETYRKIKQVDKFDDVVSNILKYKKESKVRFFLKYIVIKNVNDNLDELNKFLDLAEKIKPDEIHMNIDQCNPDFLNNGEFVIPEHYKTLFATFKEEGKRRNLNATIWDYCQSILDKGSFYK